jgi:hypothetical protein
MTAEENVFELEELLVRPGTYFNPQTEIVVVVDDSASIGQEVFNMEPYEGADWVRITDDVPVDSDSLETSMERFQTEHRAGGTVSEVTLETEHDDLDAEDANVEPEAKLDVDGEPIAEDG